MNFDGFLGTRASFMLDVVFLAMFAIVPLVAFNIWLAHSRKAYQRHKRLQVATGLLLLVAVALFELDMRINGWRHRAETSPYYGHGESMGLVFPVLYVHLFFAVTTAVLWILVIARGLRSYPDPPVPGPHSAWHRRWGRIAAWDLVLTSATGWIFYWLAFVA